MFVRASLFSPTHWKGKEDVDPGTLELAQAWWEVTLQKLRNLKNIMGKQSEKQENPEGNKWVEIAKYVCMRSSKVFKILYPDQYKTIWFSSRPWDLSPATLYVHPRAFVLSYLPASSGRKVPCTLEDWDCTKQTWDS